jgi:uncharacterized protein
MNGSAEIPPFLFQAISQLIRRGLPLGVDDCAALRRALAAGFGWASRRQLEDLCVALWAKSAAEADVVRAVFARVEAPQWDLASPQLDAERQTDPPMVTAPAAEAAPPAEPAADPVRPAVPAPAQIRKAGLTIAPPRTGSHDTSLVFFPQYPVTEREVAQTWRRLRRAVRHGPPSELDIDATLDRYARTAVVTAPVLVPLRRNTARLVVLVDRQGSMTPHHAYVDFVCGAIARAGRLDAMTVAYFRNVAGRSADHGLLSRLPDTFQPSLDPVLNLIGPLREGALYHDPRLSVPLGLSTVLDGLTPTTGVVIVSDGGAGRRRYHAGRLVDTIALVKALRAACTIVTWLNPVPPRLWAGSTAAQISRHVPMFGLTREGMHRAVDILRGRPAALERAL